MWTPKAFSFKATTSSSPNSEMLFFHMLIILPLHIFKLVLLSLSLSRNELPLIGTAFGTAFSAFITQQNIILKMYYQRILCPSISFILIRLTQLHAVSWDVKNRQLWKHEVLES